MREVPCIPFVRCVWQPKALFHNTVVYFQLYLKSINPRPLVNSQLNSGNAVSHSNSIGWDTTDTSEIMVCTVIFTLNNGCRSSDILDTTSDYISYRLAGTSNHRLKSFAGNKVMSSLKHPNMAQIIRIIQLLRWKTRIQLGLASPSRYMYVVWNDFTFKDWDDKEKSKEHAYYCVILVLALLGFDSSQKLQMLQTFRVF